MIEHIVSFQMSDDELRERLKVKENDLLDSNIGIYPTQDAEDGVVYWTIEATMTPVKV